MAQFESFFASLSTPPEEKDIPPGKDSTYSELFFHRNWGFTIYRTAYNGPASDQLWQALLADLQAQVEAAVHENRRSANGTRRPDADEALEVLSLFRVDPRSDAQGLAGLSIQQMRDVFMQDASNEQLPEKLKPMNWRPRNVGSNLFLLVDDEVMAAKAAVSASTRWNEPRMEGGPWIKCVYADYKAEDYVQRNQRVTQIFFGWMKMTTRCFVDMWEDLDLFWELERLAPKMSDESGRDGKIYDGDRLHPAPL